MTLTTPAIPTPAATASRPPGMGGHYQASITGAGLDNLFRQVTGAALVALAIKAHPHDPAKAEALGNLYTNLSALLFIAPFLLLGPLAGSLGDRLAKHHIIRSTRLAEVVLVIIGAIGLATGNVLLLLTTVGGLAIASSFFAPVKLSVIPELTTPERLPMANAWVAAITVLAILGGTGLASLTDETLLAGTPFAALGGAGMLVSLGLGLCVVGIHGAWRIGKLQAQAPHTPIAMPWAVIDQVRALSSTKGLWAPSLALGGFWSLGAVAQITMIPLAGNTYHLGQAGIAGLAVGLGLGLVVGALITPRFIAKSFPAGLPIVGAVLSSLALFAAGYHAHHGGGLAGFATCMIITGIGAGLWETPLTIILQERAPAAVRNLVMAGSGVLASLGMLMAIGIAMTLTQELGFSSAEVFMALGGCTLMVALLCGWIYRNQCAGWLMALVVNSAYHVRVSGAENLPASGGCLVVCNHLSYSDGIILGSHLPRPGRFLVYRQFVEMPVVGLFLRAGGVIPVAAEDSRRALLASIDAAIEAAKAGEVVVIFPEGKLTRSGQMDVFRAGLERIAVRAGVPVVPAHLDGLWGTVTSRAPKWAFPRPRRPVSLRIGPPLPSSTSAAEARAQVMALSYQSAQARSDRSQRTLGGEVLRRMRRHPFRAAIRDSGGVLSFCKLLGLARVLSHRLGLAADERCVGLLLPPGRGGAMANVALALLGRTAVNLNHTVGQAQLKRMCEMAGIRTIISATPYLKRIGDPGLSARMVQLDEVMKDTSAASVVIAMLAAYLLPTRLLVRAKADGIAAIIFSSGSTGDPKGVELTHRQVLANITAVSEGLELSGERDVLLSPLPLFHSFGLVPGFWLGLVLGMPSAAHPDPTDAKALGALAQASGSTFLISTPTFARGYLRRIEPEAFKHLRFAVVGAERCPPDLKQQFRERYGAELLEGYGCTELAPTVAVSLLPVKRDGVTEERSREGSVGRPLPGLNVFTIHPETHQPLPAGQEGLLVVQSPSRMRGYLDRPDLTEKAFVHGGYNTGDVGRLDADGFVYITGRLARFAKIGGEMVPLDNVENAVHQAVLAIVGPESPIEIAVAAVADEARGERLIVLHTGFSGDWEKLFAGLEPLPSLWRPKARDVRQVEAIPKLGTGKRDLAGLKKLAAAG